MDECQNSTNNCDQHCININGSYKCACDSGFTLSEDGYSCLGKFLHGLMYVCFV